VEGVTAWRGGCLHSSRGEGERVANAVGVLAGCAVRMLKARGGVVDPNPTPGPFKGTRQPSQSAPVSQPEKCEEWEETGNDSGNVGSEGRGRGRTRVRRRWRAGCRAMAAGAGRWYRELEAAAASPRVPQPSSRVTDNKHSSNRDRTCPPDSPGTRISRASASTDARRGWRRTNVEFSACSKHPPSPPRWRAAPYGIAA